MKRKRVLLSGYARLKIAEWSVVSLKIVLLLRISDQGFLFARNLERDFAIQGVFYFLKGCRENLLCKGVRGFKE